MASRPPAVELAATPTSSAEIGRVDLTSSVLQPLLLAQLSTLRRATLEAQYPLIPSVDLPAVFTLLEPRDIVLVIFFRLPGRAGAPEGHLAISNLSPGPSESLFLDDLAHAGTSVEDVKGVRSMFEQTDQARWALAESVLDGPLGREDDPVRLEVASETETVDWNFASGCVSLASLSSSLERRGTDASPNCNFCRPCPLAVSYTLTNTSARLAACVNLTLLPPVSCVFSPPRHCTRREIADCPFYRTLLFQLRPVRACPSRWPPLAQSDTRPALLNKTHERRPCLPAWPRRGRRRLAARG